MTSQSAVRARPVAGQTRLPGVSLLQSHLRLPQKRVVALVLVISDMVALALALVLAWYVRIGSGVLAYTAPADLLPYLRAILAALPIFLAIFALQRPLQHGFAAFGHAGIQRRVSLVYVWTDRLACRHLHGARAAPVSGMVTAQLAAHCVAGRGHAFRLAASFSVVAPLARLADSARAHYRRQRACTGSREAVGSLECWHRDRRLP